MGKIFKEENIMRTQNAKLAEVKDVARRVLSILALNVHADEGIVETPPTGSTGGTGGSPIDVTALINTARQEEKDKLYPQINSLKEKLKLATDSCNDAMLKAAEWKQKYEEAVKKAENGEDTEEVKNLKAQIEVLNNKIKELQDNSPDEATLRTKIEKEYEVKNHLASVREKNKGSVLDVFMDEIKGETIEDIDASLQRAIEKSNSVREQVTGSTTPTGQTTTPTPQQSVVQSNPTPPATPPVANPNGSEVPKDKFSDPAYIRSLTPGTPEYNEFRKHIGLTK